MRKSCFKTLFNVKLKQETEWKEHKEKPEQTQRPHKWSKIVSWFSVSFLPKLNLRFFRASKRKTRGEFLESVFELNKQELYRNILKGVTFNCSSTRWNFTWTFIRKPFFLQRMFRSRFFLITEIEKFSAVSLIAILFIVQAVALMHMKNKSVSRNAKAFLENFSRRRFEKKLNWRVSWNFKIDCLKKLWVEWRS